MSRGLDVESSFYLRVIDPNYLYSSHPYLQSQYIKVPLYMYFAVSIHQSIFILVRYSLNTSKCLYTCTLQSQYIKVPLYMYFAVSVHQSIFILDIKVSLYLYFRASIHQSIPIHVLRSLNTSKYLYTCTLQSQYIKVSLYL